MQGLSNKTIETIRKQLKDFPKELEEFNDFVLEYEDMEEALTEYQEYEGEL